MAIKTKTDDDVLSDALSIDRTERVTANSERIRSLLLMQLQQAQGVYPSTSSSASLNTFAIGDVMLDASGSLAQMPQVNAVAPLAVADDEAA